jgi:hypothetical protein
LCKTSTALSNIFEIITHDSTVATTNLPLADDGNIVSIVALSSTTEQQLDVSLVQFWTE